MSNIKISSPRGGIKVGVFGAAGYTGGELIRLLTNHPSAEIVFANSESNAGNKVCEVHEGLYGDCDLQFTSEYAFDKVDVIFLCFGHGKSEAFLQEHSVPDNVKIIDLAQDFRIRGNHDFVYGLPEIHRDAIIKCSHLANPGCFATAIQLGLLPLAKAGLLTHDVSVNAITGSTGAGQKPGSTTHFSWRSDNLSIYKVFTQGNFTRGIFCTEVVRLDKTDIDAVSLYKAFYQDAAFTHYVDSPLDMKQVVNTNKCLLHIDQFDNKLVITSIIDNLLKGAVGQAVQNMNLMFGLDEKAGLMLKASAF